jgi:hypothetical protein
MLKDICRAKKDKYCLISSQSYVESKNVDCIEVESIESWLSQTEESKLREEK